MHLPDQAAVRGNLAAGAALARVAGVHQESEFPRKVEASMCLGYFSGIGCLGSILLSILLTLVLTLCTNLL